MKPKTLTKKEKEELQKEFPVMPRKKSTRKVHKTGYYLMQNAKVVLVYTLILIIVLGAILGFIWCLLQIIYLAKFIW